MDKLKKDMQNAESDVVEFSKTYDHTGLGRGQQTEEETGQQGAELENALDSLKTECSSLKEVNLKLEKGTEETVKAGVEIFRNQFEFTQDYENLQAFFVNFGVRKVLSKLKSSTLLWTSLQLKQTIPFLRRPEKKQPNLPLTEH
ncbi:Uncharacterized protein Fot_36479 [Forsythia ovata]|uniref:Uncharacterized protein n=1 Tax=Forsythia ovata TaxID=205694 RepID=A0ABD1SPH7_9LAMI